MRMRSVTPIKLLRQFVRQYRSQREAAEALGVSQNYLSQVLTGTRAMPQLFLDRLEIRRVERFYVSEKD